jgi:enediyne polyketide synthase
MEFVKEDKSESNSSIAVIGMGCVYPGAHSPEELWQNVLAGRRYFRKMPSERLPRSDYYDPDPKVPGKTYCDQMAVITDWAFDPLEFHIPPVVMHATDIAHWLALWTANEAILDAGLALNKLDREKIGLILGNTLTGEFFRSHALRFRWPYMERSIRKVLEHNSFEKIQIDSLLKSIQYSFESALPEINEDSLAGNMSNTIAGRICNHFDLGAGGYVVDGACSSSLLSVAHACNALLNGEMDIALAGGVDVSLDPFEIVGFAKTKALAADDIRPYDDQAAGMLAGEGCGIFVLAKEEYARTAGYRIHALIKGWGYSSDGSGGLTSPEVEGQKRALNKAYGLAGYPISSVGLFEGHGTGTALGDRVEISALKDLIDSSPDHGPCWLGSIKSNIGHCKAAAGGAGLVKAIMALKRKMLPPSMNCIRPNPQFGIPLSRLRPVISGRDWRATDKPRRASVSSMGFGGANSHVTLEEANPAVMPTLDDISILNSHQKCELLLIAAQTYSELQETVEKLISIAGRICRAELTDLSAALAAKAQKGKIRLAIVCESPWDLEKSLQLLHTKIASGSKISHLDDPASGIFAGYVRKNPKCVALFPGQGSQRLNMGESFLQRYPFVQNLYESCDQAVGAIVPEGLQKSIFMDPYANDAQTMQQAEVVLRDTRISQPAIVLTSIAILQILDFFGIRPDIAIGHSLGEITAFHAMGVFDAQTAVRVAALRGHAMSSLNLQDPGGMVAIADTPQSIDKLIEPFQGNAIISNYNSFKQTVVSGSSTVIEALTALCKKQDIQCIKLPVSHGFHSPIVTPAAEAFLESLHDVTFHALNGMVISPSTGGEVPLTEDIKKLLGQQIQNPVRFTDAIEEVTAHRPDLWIEIGPGKVLSNLVADILAKSHSACLPTDIQDNDTSRSLNELLGRAYALGFSVNLDNLFAHRFHRPFSIEGYDPKFITNPCERHVDISHLDKVQPADSLVGKLIPEGINPENFKSYIKIRQQFLKEYIALDYHNFPSQLFVGSGQSYQGLEQTAASSKEVISEPKIREPEEPAIEEDILTFAINSIAERTGFPPASIKPEMKLRDDLNLDSIKVGELAILLTRKFKGTFGADPSSFVNAPLHEMIEAMQVDVQEERIDTAAADGTDYISQENIIPDNIRNFQMTSSYYPIDHEENMELPAAGTILLVSETESSRRQTLSKSLNRAGLATIFGDFLSFDETVHLPDDLVGLIIILPEMENSFFACTSTEFDNRIDGLITKLFQTYKLMEKTLEPGWPGFRSLVLQPVSAATHSDVDLESGAGFLKSLRQEYPLADFKWLSMPNTWPDNQWAATAIQEIEVTTGRLAYHFTEDGQRLAMIAQPTEFTEKEILQLDETDTFLVTGGAKGITFELVRELSRRTGIKLAILGSSPLGDSESDTNRNNEVFRNLQWFEKEGIRYRYFQCDVTDQLAVQKTVREVGQALGTVTGILHGAGVSQLKLFREMDLQTCIANIRVKARGLYNILSAVSLDKLKALHVISSILGSTGMSGQSDYTFANAWLNGALQSVLHFYPHIHCLSLGYSIWSETGLGKKLGAVESLAKQGITPINSKDGIDSYIQLTRQPCLSSTFLIIGRMTPELEATLFAPAQKPDGRFLEKIQRWVPAGELVADTSISHSTDTYISEHVFDGTPVFPGVMVIEAMVEAALACTGRKDMPVLQSIRFSRPLIVPADDQVIMRVMAVADPPQSGMIRVKMAIRSESDGFKQNHFRADCVFGADKPHKAEIPVCPDLPEKLSVSTEEFSPAPLFQGKFLRRISSIYRLEPASESITEITVPEGEQYFENVNNSSIFTVSPAARDSALQSGALALPVGFLPVEIDELRIYRDLKPGSRIICHAIVQKKPGDRFMANINLYDESGQVLETIKGLILQAPRSAINVVEPYPQIPMSRVETDLYSFFESKSFGIAAVDHSEVDSLAATDEFKQDELEFFNQEIADPRRPSAIANLLATRRAAVLYARDHFGTDIDPTHVFLNHQADGKPDLHIDKESTVQGLQSAGVSVADDAVKSIAMVGPTPVGLDFETIKDRDAETWRGLLGEDGYKLARQLVDKTSEPFDKTATRVWSLVEAGKKANSLQKHVPTYETHLGGPWYLFKGDFNGNKVNLLSTVFYFENESNSVKALAVAVDQLKNGRNIRKMGFPSKDLKLPVTPQRSFEQVTADFFHQLEAALILCNNDPKDAGTDEHYQLFKNVVKTTIGSLKEIEKHMSAVEVKQKQNWMYGKIKKYLKDSIVFRRTLEKPLGYPGDHLLMNMMFYNELRAGGLGYHFDRYFLENPGSEAVRQRSYWVAERIRLFMEENGMSHISLLDLGFGPMAIERTLLEKAAPGQTFSITGFDLDERAISFVEKNLVDSRATLNTEKHNLISPQGVARIREMAAHVDVCICMGLIEYLEKDAATAILEAVYEGGRSGTRMLTSNYRPDHPSLTDMEWFLDWWLVYRSEKEMAEIMRNAGFNEDRIFTQLDKTESIVLVEAEK